VALQSLHFILWLTDGVTILSSTDRASGDPLPYSLPVLYRGYLTASTHTIYATLPEGREAAGLAPLLAQLAFFGGVSSTTGLLPLWAHAPAPPPHPTNHYRVINDLCPTKHHGSSNIPILTASPLTFALPSTTAPRMALHGLWTLLHLSHGLYQTPRR
jgi:hypothetical protein